MINPNSQLPNEDISGPWYFEKLDILSQYLNFPYVFKESRFWCTEIQKLAGSHCIKVWDKPTLE